MEENKKKRFAIIQLTRMGDLIQTIQSCQILKEQKNDIELILIARKQFIAPLKFIAERIFDQIIEVDARTLFQESKDINELKEKQKELITTINTLEIDVLINLSFSKSSNYLSSLIKATHKLGTRYDYNGHIEVTDQWSQHVFSSILRGSSNPFNLVDIYNSILGVRVKKIPIVKKRTSKEIVLHPFSSHSKKNWKSKKWVEIIFKVLRENTDFSLSIVGSKDENERALEIIKDPLLETFSERITNYCGQTTIEQLYDILLKSSHFIGHDSMVGHLAKLTQLPSLTISLGSVRPIETAPYGPGQESYVMTPKTKCFPCFPDDKCDYYQCHADVSFQASASFINLFLKKGNIQPSDIKKNISPFYLNSVSIYQTQTTDAHLLNLVSLTEDNLSIEDIFKVFTRIATLFKFSSIEETQLYPKLNKTTYAELLKSMEGVQHLYELADFGKKYSHYILKEISEDSPSLEKIKSYSDKIDEIDRLQGLLKRSYPILSPVIEYFETVKGNLIGTNIVELSESSFSVFNDCAMTCSILNELAEKTLAEYKILEKKSPIQKANRNR